MFVSNRMHIFLLVQTCAQKSFIPTYSTLFCFIPTYPLFFSFLHRNSFRPKLNKLFWAILSRFSTENVFSQRYWGSNPCSVLVEIGLFYKDATRIESWLDVMSQYLDVSFSKYMSHFLKKKRRYLRGWPLFFETFHVRVIHLKIKYFITTQIEKIRQNLLWKETYVAPGKAAAIVLKAWVQRYPSGP